MIPSHPFLAQSHIWWLGITLLGLAVGLVAGMFGVGGGFLMVPLLNVFFAVPLDIAVGSGLCQMIGTAAAAFRRHCFLHQGEVKIDWIMMAGSLLGVQLGADTVESLSNCGVVAVLGHPIPAMKFWISLVYIIMLGGVGAWMLYDARRHPDDLIMFPGPLTRIHIPPYTWLPNTGQHISIPVVAYIGLLMGFLSGLLGIGGGVALMPILIYGIGMRIRTAAGTGILMLVVTSIAGTLAHAQLGHVDLRLAVALLLGSTIGAPIGATMTSRVNSRHLRGIFAYLVFLTAVAVLWNLLR